MKKIILLTLSIFLVFALLSGYAQSGKVVEKIIEIGTTDNRTMDHLDVICNRFGGRLVGSDAFENAAEWCAAQFREWGMEVEMDEAGEFLCYNIFLLLVLIL